ncbi:hypothetical protein EDC01DRAFT_781996 [Geopyxis carbonaria]|nr:hypothetical protein EDC01DRAFT_781996 [Geopyxis carbonaria]
MASSYFPRALPPPGPDDDNWGLANMDEDMANFQDLYGDSDDDDDSEDADDDDDHWALFFRRLRAMRITIQGLMNQPRTAAGSGRLLGMLERGPLVGTGVTRIPPHAEDENVEEDGENEEDGEQEEDTEKEEDGEKEEESTEKDEDTENEEDTEENKEEERHEGE